MKKLGLIILSTLVFACGQLSVASGTTVKNKTKYKISFATEFGTPDKTGAYKIEYVEPGKSKFFAASFPKSEGKNTFRHLFWVVYDERGKEIGNYRSFNPDTVSEEIFKKTNPKDFERYKKNNIAFSDVKARYEYPHEITITGNGDTYDMLEVSGLITKSNKKNLQAFDLRTGTLSKITAPKTVAPDKKPFQASPATSTSKPTIKPTVVPGPKKEEAKASPAPALGKQTVAPAPKQGPTAEELKKFADAKKKLEDEKKAKLKADDERLKKIKEREEQIREDRRLALEKAKKEAEEKEKAKQAQGAPVPAPAPKKEEAQAPAPQGSDDDLLPPPDLGDLTFKETKTIKVAPAKKEGVKAPAPAKGEDLQEQLRKALGKRQSGMVGQEEKEAEREEARAKAKKQTKPETAEQRVQIEESGELLPPPDIEEFGKPKTGKQTLKAPDKQTVQQKIIPTGGKTIAQELEEKKMQKGMGLKKTETKQMTVKEQEAFIKAQEEKAKIERMKGIKKPVIEEKSAKKTVKGVGSGEWED